MSGKVENIYIAHASRDAVTEVKQAELVANKGLAGDRYHSRATESLEPDGAVPINNISLISREVLDEFLANNKAEIDYGDFRRNIITSGVDLNSLVGKEFLLGSALCKGTELCEPCAFLAATVHRAILPELVHKGGLRATVLSDDEIEAGSEIKISKSTTDV